MIKISIIGSGNVAQHLITAFKESSTIQLVQVYARHRETITHLLPTKKIINTLAELTKVDLYIIAIHDDAISTLSDTLPFTNRFVVHTSGSLSVDYLNNKNRRGVFYPVQTFTKNKTIDFKTVPLCLESEHEADYILLKKVAQSISDSIYSISSKQRKSLHIAAIFVNNFVNNLYQIGNEICVNNDVPFAILKPLIMETANKIMSLSPIKAQTGPAIRKDQQTINTHLSFLENELYKDIYKKITESIQTNHDKEL